MDTPVDSMIPRIYVVSYSTSSRGGMRSYSDCYSLDKTWPCIITEMREDDDRRYCGRNPRYFNGMTIVYRGNFDDRNAEMSRQYADLLYCLEASGQMRKSRSDITRPFIWDENNITEDQNLQLAQWTEAKKTQLVKSEWLYGELDVVKHMTDEKRCNALKVFFDNLPPGTSLPKELLEVKEIGMVGK